ncbi:hypothetical protein QN277_019800 [Acacia crassicarpa]|uniref:Uncharacterized protein n=1 Tax=Acacia crassicarpa TaxID=499986 RepID=A0AAE1JLJ8_9FABA|nr:hypothetical protein QN277_019800 [Acacia crassicarpa]
MVSGCSSVKDEVDLVVFETDNGEGGDDGKEEEEKMKGKMVDKARMEDSGGAEEEEGLQTVKGRNKLQVYNAWNLHTKSESSIPDSSTGEEEEELAESESTMSH